MDETLENKTINQEIPISVEYDPIFLETLKEEKEEIINLKNEISSIKEFLTTEKEEKEKLEKQLIKQQKEEQKKIDEEIINQSLVLKEKEDSILSLENDRHEELIEVLSTPQEFLSYKEELAALNDNLVNGFTSALIFVGVVLGIVLSGLFLKAVYK